MCMSPLDDPKYLAPAGSLSLDTKAAAKTVEKKEEPEDDGDDVSDFSGSDADSEDWDSEMDDDSPRRKAGAKEEEDKAGDGETQSDSDFLQVNVCWVWMFPPLVLWHTRTMQSTQLTARCCSLQIAKLAEATGLSLDDVGKMSKDQRKLLSVQAKAVGKSTAMPRVTLISPVPMALPEGTPAPVSTLSKVEVDDDDDDEEDEAAEADSEVSPRAPALKTRAKSLVVCSFCVRIVDTSSDVADSGAQEDVGEDERVFQVHAHPLALSSSKIPWHCDGRSRHCTDSSSNRYRCTQGCDFDLCETCWNALVYKSASGKTRKVSKRTLAEEALQPVERVRWMWESSDG